MTLLETGRSVEEAAAGVGVNPSTVARWAARGRAGADSESVAFAERYDAIRQGAGVQRLSEDDVVRAVELAVRNGSVTAMKILLDRFKAEGDVSVRTDNPLAELDELAERRRAG